MKRLPVMVLCLGLPMVMTAQQDSADFRLEQLSANDVVTPASRALKVVSTNRTAQDLRDISYSMHVVTKEEILDNGYNTLVDVLKHVPGIKVSQPGSAIDGESFMMRGFYGNYYTKILINSIPITPSVVGGMPLGAQLPIKQAERIEIIYGPAAAIYGADAMAGVINIITQQSDKSLYAQADISTGNLGLANLNMTVGGKLGKGKHLFRYRFWGGYLQMDDLNTKFDREFNYNPLTYDETGSYLDEPSYSGSIDSVGLGELPTESRYFGTDLNYRNWRFTYHYMGREYHSSIGLNPISSVYDQPGTLFAENINSLNLSYTKAFSRLTLTSNLSYLNYRLDESSNYFSVFNFQHPFFNYFYGASDDVRFEQIAAFTFSPSISLVTGGTFQYSGNLPFTTYLDEPFDPDEYSPFSTTSFRDEDDMLGPGGEDATPFLIPDPITFSRYSLFAEWSFNFGNFRAQAGGRFDNNSEFGSTFSPRLGMTFRINDNHILRGSFSMANRNPSSYHTYNTLELRRVPRMGGPGDTLIYFPVVNDELTTERLITGELGIRNFFSEDMTWDVSVYFNNNQDHFTFSLLDRNLNNPEDVEFLGYVSDEEAINRQLGIQSTFAWKEIIPAIHLRSDLYFSYAQGTFQFPFDNGEIDRWPMVPSWMGQARVACEPVKSLLIGFTANFSGSWVSRGILTEEELDDFEDFVVQSGYFTLDLRARYKLNKHFQVYLKVNNALNKEYAGIGATGTLYDLVYNPQLRRTLEYGLSFRFN